MEYIAMTQTHDQLFFEDLYTVAWLLFLYVAVVYGVSRCVRSRQKRSFAILSIPIAIIAAASLIAWDLQETSANKTAAGVAGATFITCLIGSALFFAFDIILLFHYFLKREVKGHSKIRRASQRIRRSE